MMRRPCVVWLLCVIASALRAPAAAPYPTAHDKPLAPKEVVNQDAPEFTRLRVEFNGIRGGRVPAYLYLPKGDAAAPKRPAVLLQYGSGGNKNTHYIVLIAQRFVRKGFIVLTIDVPGRGERRAEKRGLLDGKVIETLGDYSRAVDYLVTRPEVDPDRIAYCGISWGAITGLTFAAHDPRIKVMASLVGGGGFLGIVPGKVEDEARQAVEQWDPVYHMQLFAERPLLLLNVTKDQLVPRGLSEALHKAAPATAKKLWLDTDHFFNGLDREHVADQVGEFIEEGLAQVDRQRRLRQEILNGNGDGRRVR